ncbi:MAG: hypothetical protein JNK72_03350 [Myxococcales bacterium]|nr:hypothetical protein [Myxococcales bacterium]
MLQLRAKHVLPLMVLAVSVGVSAERRVFRGALFSRGAAPVRLGRAVPGVASHAASACASCHAEIADEWRASQHRGAWHDRVFQAAYQREPMAFCRHCHAPLAEGPAPSREEADEGVSCAVCHVRSGAVLGARARADTPHPVLAAGLGASTYCAGCHQFNFPGDTGGAEAPYATDEPMQDTFAEWQMSASGQRGESCQSCHMPWVEGPNGRRHRSHRFVGGADPALVRQAVSVRLVPGRTADAVEAAVSLVPGRLGHAFPTGDLFRRVELRVWADDDEAHAQTVVYARAFAPVLERSPRGAMLFVRRQSRDTRVMPPGLGAPEVETLRFGRDTRTLNFRLQYLLMPTPMAASHGIGTPENQLTVEEGRVALEGAR